LSVKELNAAIIYKSVVPGNDISSHSSEDTIRSSDGGTTRTSTSISSSRSGNQNIATPAFNYNIFRSIIPAIMIIIHNPKSMITDESIQCGFAFDQLDKAGAFDDVDTDNHHSLVQEDKLTVKADACTTTETSSNEVQRCGVAFKQLDQIVVFNDGTKTVDEEETQPEQTLEPTCTKIAERVSEEFLGSIDVGVAVSPPTLRRHQAMTEPGAFLERPNGETRRTHRKINFSTLSNQNRMNNPTFQSHTSESSNFDTSEDPVDGGTLFSSGMGRCIEHPPATRDAELVATLVIDDSYLEIAEEQHNTDTDKEKASNGQNSVKINRLVGILLSLFCAGMISTALWAGLEKRRDGAAATIASASTTSLRDDFENVNLEAPKDENYLMNLLPSYSQRAIEFGAEAVQKKASSWLLGDPNFQAGNYSVSRIRQRYALATFYYATDGDRWDNNNYWLSYELHECHWFFRGPEAIWYAGDAYDEAALGPCKGAEEYKSLLSFKNRLKGRIPPEIGLLSGLVNIDLSFNEMLTGTLPTEIGHLTLLERLQLVRDGLSGPIPTEIGKMEFLRELRLESNHLSGPIPTEVGKLTNMNWFWGFDNIFSGSLPSELGLWPPTMSRLELFGNSFTGTIPTQLGLLTDLGELTLGENLLSGQIPSELGNLNAGMLTLQGNQLTGTIPTQLGNIETIYRLYFYSNDLTGTIPTEFGNLSGMQILLLHDNMLTGEVPSELGNMKEHLTHLYLNFNQQTGVVPPEWSDALQLKFDFDWDKNRFTGILPSTLGLLTKLEYIWLASNDFSSTLPSELGRLKNLIGFSVAQNVNLSGTIPVELGIMASEGDSPLSSFNVSGTSLSGTIPVGLCAVDSVVLGGFDCSAQLCGCECECFATVSP